MSDFTIEQLEALKEGTTPGPWDEDVIYPDCSYIVDDTGGRDAALAFTTPGLVDALISEKQENQRLRAEIEAVLDVVKHETWLHDDEGQFPETVQLGSYVAGQLTRILEATDE